MRDYSLLKRQICQGFCAAGLLPLAVSLQGAEDTCGDKRSRRWSPGLLPCGKIARPATLDDLFQIVSEIGVEGGLAP